jgi:sugar lactone lactonase YvrE
MSWRSKSTPTRCAAVLAIGAALLPWPATAANDLYVVSQFTSEVLVYNGVGGAFSHAFITPIADGFSNPGGMSLQTSTSELYVTSTGTGEIWRYDAALGTVITPPAATLLIAPGAAAFDASGSALYFAAAANEFSEGTDTVMKLVISSGTVSTLDTDATAEFSALAVNGSDLYVSDTNNGEVVRIPTGGGSGTTVISGLASPGGILFLSATDMLVAETGGDRVLEYTFNGSSWVFLQEVLATSSGVDGPSGLALAPGGTLSVSGSFTNDVVSVDLTTLLVSPLVAAGAAGLGSPKDLIWNGSTLLAMSPRTNAVIYYDATGNPTGTSARGKSTPANSGMTVAPSGNILVGSLNDNDVIEYDGVGGGTLGAFFDACPTSLAAPYDQVVGADGNVYISCPDSGAVYLFDGVTRSPIGDGAFVVAGSGGLVTPRGLVFAPGGNLLVSSFTGEILEYDGSSGAFVGVFVDTTGNGGGPIDPWGLAIHDGNLFVASRFADAVMEFDGTTGAFVQTIVTSGSGGLDGPTALDFGPGDDLYVTSYEDDAVRRYDGATGAFIEVFVTSGSAGLDGPIDLQFVPEPAATGALASGALLLWGLYAWRRRGSRTDSR